MSGDELSTQSTAVKTRKWRGCSETVSRFDFRKLLPPVLLLVPAVLFFSRTIWFGEHYFAFDSLRVLYPWNSVGHVIPHNTLISDPIFHNYLDGFQLRQGVLNGYLPLWRDDVFCGQPFLLFWQCPLRVLMHAILPVATAHSLLLFMNLYLSGLFAYYFLRNRRLAMLSALTGAMAWMFNGFVMVWLEYEFSVMFAAALPAAFWLIDLAIRQRRKWAWPALALVNAYAIAITFPHLMYYYFIAGGSYVLYLWWRGGVNGRRRMIGTLVGYGITVLTAMICTAGFWVTAAGMFGSGQRREWNVTELYRETGQLPWRHLLTMIHPEFFGTPVENRCYIPAAASQIYNNYNELAVYCGVVVLLLALVGCCRRRWRGDHLFFILLGGLSLWAAAGSFWYPWVARLLPGLTFSTPTRVLFLTGFSWTVLAAFGMQVLLFSQWKKRVVMLIPLLVILLFVAAIAYVNTTTGALRIFSGGTEMPAPEWIKEFNGWHSPFVRSSFFWLLSGSGLMIMAIVLQRSPRRTFVLTLLAITAGAELFVFSWRYNSVASSAMIYPLTPGIVRLQSDSTVFRVASLVNPLGGNSLSAFGLQNIGGYFSILSCRYEFFFNLMQYGKPGMGSVGNRWFSLTQFSPPLLSLSNVKYLLLPPGSLPVKSDFLTEIYRGEMVIYLNKTYLPRAFFVATAEGADNDNAMAEQLCSMTLEALQQKVVLEANALSAVNVPGNPVSSSIPVVLTEYHPGYLSCRLSSPVDGWLVVTNNYDPDWQALVDGRPGTIVRADFTFQAIRIDAGTHQVELCYRPRLVIWATLFSYVCWLLLMVITMRSYWRRYRIFSR